MFTTTRTNTMQTNTHVSSVTISREDATRLAAQVAGEVLLPEDNAYAAECATYNLNRVLEPV